MLTARTEPRVSVDAEGIYLNNKKFIDKKAELQFAVFDALVDHYFHEFKNGSEYISIKNMKKKMSGKFKNSDPIQISKAIYNIRDTAKKILRNDSYSIITSEKWQGYRLNDDIFLARKMMSRKTFWGKRKTLKKAH